MDSYSALIIDDEPLLRRHLDHHLSELWPTLEIIGMAGNGVQALELIERHQPDLIFLDIRMPEMDGLTVAKKLAALASPPLIIFTTAYDQYAVEAFEQEAMDYLLKPIEIKRLEKTVSRAQKRLSNKQSPSSSPSENLIADLLSRLTPPPSPKQLEWIKASRQDSIHMISVHDVHYFQAEDKYTTVFTADGHYVIRTSIKELKTELDPQLFWQIHRGILVHSAQIEKVKRDFTGRMHVYLKDNGAKLPVSRNFQSMFKQM